MKKMACILLLLSTWFLTASPAFALNGVCGTAHGQTMAAAPTTDLCNSGTPSAVSGSGPWTWQCAETDGGATADCIAALVPIEGDVNGDGAMTLVDTVLAMQVIAGMKVNGMEVHVERDESDTNADGRIDLSDVLYILQRLADLRKPLTTAAIGSVTLPAGSLLTIADVRVQSLLGKVAVQPNGTYAVPQPSAGPAIVMLTDPQGRPMLMGYADAGDHRMGEISPLSTATALMFLDSSGTKLPSETWKTVLGLIASEPSVKNLAAVIETRLALDSGALANGDEAIKSAIGTARTALASMTAPASTPTAQSSAVKRSASATDPVEITVITQNPASGIQVSGEPNGDGLLIQNDYRRHCYYWIYYTGYKDQDDVEHPLSEALWQTVDSGYLKSTSGLSGVIGTSLDYFIWEKLPYDPVKIGPFTLDKAPSDAKQGYYKIVIVGGTTIFGALPPAWVMDSVNIKEYFLKQQLMGIISVVKDYFLPLAFAFAPPELTKSWTGQEAAEICQALLNLFTKAGINVAQNINANDYDAAWRALEKEFLANADLRNVICKFLVKKALTYALSPERLEQVSAAAENYAAIMKCIDKAMLIWDLGGVKEDLLKSNGYEYFDVVAVTPNIHIEPSSKALMPGDEQTFNALMGPVAGDSFEYRWTVTGGAGKLHRDGETTLATTITTSSPTIVYKASASVVDTVKDTITVEVYRKWVKDDGVVIQFIGSDEAVVTVGAAPVQELYKHYRSDDGNLNIVHMAYFILKKKKPSKYHYCITLEDNGYFYSPEPRDELWGEGDMGSYEFCTGLGGTAQYNITELPTTLSDHVFTQAYPRDLLKIVPISDDEMIFIVGMYDLNINESHADAEQVLQGWYDDWKIKERWDAFISKAKYWTVTNIFTY